MFSFKKFLAEEKERQHEEQRGIEEEVLTTLESAISEAKIDDIDFLYIYVMSNYRYCKSFSIGFAYRSTFEEESFLNLNYLGRFGDFISKDECFNLLKSVKKKLQEEGFKTTECFEQLEIGAFCIEV